MAFPISTAEAETTVWSTFSALYNKQKFLRQKNNNRNAKS